MKKIILILILISSICIQVNYGQQDPQYTQYMYNMNVMNPAYAGSRETLSIGILGRTQWVGLNGAPKTLTFSAHAPFSQSVGLGFSAIADENGPVKEQNLYADFSYTLQTSEEGRLAFGLKGGITLKDIGLFSLTTVETSDPAFNDNVNSTNPNFGAGAFYYTDKFYVGLSIPNILQVSHLKTENGKITDVSEQMHYFITGGYVFDLTSSLKFKPSTMIKAVSGAPISMDLSANFLYNKKLELGASYRLDDSVSGLITFEIARGFRIGYAYDYTTSNLGDFNDGSHEAFLLWDIFDTDKDIKSPRFF
ncbi:MAG: type IX secretion system membrane protein PorP/SprF [Aureibaculum sp.]